MPLEAPRRLGERRLLVRTGAPDFEKIALT